jgi:hypothetical protein
MRTMALILGFMGICLMAAAPQAAQAQATRTWVSGVGDDVNPCSRTAPCKTFAGAISKTSAGGEIDALDPGGFGTVTITKAVTIDGGAGTVGSILASATNGVNVNAGASDRIILRNLSINGAGTTVGLNAVSVIAAASVTIENVIMMNFTQACVSFLPAVKTQLVIVGSTLDNCGTNALTVGTTATTGVNRVDITGSSFQKSGAAISVGANSIVAINESLIVNSNGTTNAGGVLATAAGAQVFIQNSTIANNASFGLHASGGGAISVTQSMIVGTAGVGMQADTGGTISSWGNNYFAGNSGGDGASTSTLTAK